MELKTSITLLFLLTLAATPDVRAQVIINEVMAQNSNTLTDPDFG